MNYKKTFRSKEEQKAIVEAFLKQTKSAAEYARLKQIPQASFHRYLQNYDNFEANKTFKTPTLRTEDEKKDLVIKFAQSDEAITIFCKQNDVAYASFYRFLNKYNDLYKTEKEKYEANKQKFLIENSTVVQNYSNSVIEAQCDSLIKSARETLESCEAIQKSQIKITLALAITNFIFLMIYLFTK